jgi:hypothetical protein
MTPLRPVLSVIVPLTDDPHCVGDLLDALAMSELPRREWELIVVSTGQPEATIVLAAQRADVIVRLSGSWARGSAYLCNRGAEVARAPVLVFLDHDVVVRPDTLRGIERAFADTTLAAIVAGVEPAERSATVATRYVTRMHDWAHSRCLGDSEHFSTRCGAIRAPVFTGAGELDEWQRPPVDCAATELGLRLRALGHRVELRSDVRVENRHSSSLVGAARPLALQQSPPPWLRDEMRRTDKTATHRFRVREQLLSMMVWCAAALFAFAAARGSRVGAAAGGLIAAIVLVSELPLLWYITRDGGFVLALTALPLRVASLFLHGAHIVADDLRFHIIGEPRPDPGLEALTEVGAEIWPPAPARPHVAAEIELASLHSETVDVSNS